jgi:hypothetical protein
MVSQSFHPSAPILRVTQLVVCLRLSGGVPHVTKISRDVTCIKTVKRRRLDAMDQPLYSKNAKAKTEFFAISHSRRAMIWILARGALFFSQKVVTPLPGQKLKVREREKTTLQEVKITM